ncbi:unnamed protein product [[Candida] boidinii]|uniref:Unnamed protein product n=1 Tax=Candida boidinii TaxID=5477 RepID=A0A9W6T0K7_CANBO|nr:unnamed protein product [[Candida] boidinii]GMF99433.1 unnamed protein product [[Candida] boidinii]
MDKFKQLEQWLTNSTEKEIPKAIISSNLKVIDLPQLGRCIVAAKDLNTHESIITIPHTFMLNYITILMHFKKWNPSLPFSESLAHSAIYLPDYSHFKDTFGNFYRSLTEEEILSLNSFQLISMYIILEKRRATDSFWKPFIDVLPVLEELRNIPFTWIINKSQTEDEIFQLLPPDIKTHSIEQLQKFEQDYKGVSNLIDKHSQYNTKDALYISKDEFLWAWLCCNSRCLYMELPKKLKKTVEDNFTLVPFVDFINHISDDSCTTTISHKQGYMVSTGTVKYKENDQIFFTYGSHSDNFLIMEYGFMLPTCSNKSNYLDMTHIINKLLNQQQIEFLKENHYFELHYATKEEISFTTEIALATLQDFKDGNCSRSLRGFIDGTYDGAKYTENNKLLIKKIIAKLSRNTDNQLEKIKQIRLEIPKSEYFKLDVLETIYLNMKEIEKCHL